MGSSAQSLEGILEKHYKAHSQEIWDQINTFSSDVEWSGPYDLIRGEILAKKPNLFYLVSRKSRVIEAFDGREAWTRAPWSKDQIQIIPGDRAETLPIVLSFGSPISKEASLTHRGKVQVDGQLCHWLIESKKNFEIEYFINAKTHLFYKVIYSKKLEEGNGSTLTKTVTTYRTFNGVVCPTVVEVKTPTSESEYVFDNIILGEGIASSKFKKPNG